MSRRYGASGDDSNTLAAYLREIAKLPRLTIDEERDLGSRIQRDNDQAAISRLVESNLRFVVSYAKRYRGLGPSLLDLIHEGNLGLIEAAKRFDPSRNVKFITYGVWWIREAMMRALSDETRTLQEIGDRMRLSRERVRQIESRAKEKLRHSARLRNHLN